MPPLALAVPIRVPDKCILIEPKRGFQKVKNDGPGPGQEFKGEGRFQNLPFMLLALGVQIRIVFKPGRYVEPLRNLTV